MLKIACYAPANLLFWQYIPRDFFMYTSKNNGTTNAMLYFHGYTIYLAARLFCDMVLKGCPIKPAASFFITFFYILPDTIEVGLKNREPTVSHCGYV